MHIQLANVIFRIAIVFRRKIDMSV